MASSVGRVNMDGVSDAHKSAFAEAKELVSALEHRFPNAPFRVQGELAKMSEKLDPTPENVHKMRVLEVAEAYRQISNGEGGVAPDAHKNGINRMNAALRGQNHASPGLLPSERIAISGTLSHTPSEHMVKNGGPGMPAEHTGKGGSLLARAAAGMVAAGAAGLAAAAEPDATPSKVFNKSAMAAVDSQLPGFTAFTEGKICKGVGELTGATASGAVVAGGVAMGSAAVIYTGGLAGALVGGVAAKATMDASAATYNLTAPAAEAGCHATVQAVRKFTQRLGI